MTQVRKHEQTPRSDQQVALFRVLKVVNIPFSMTEASLKEYFSTFGDIACVHCSRVSTHGIATIVFYDMRSARQALLKSAGATLGGRRIKVFPIKLCNGKPSGGVRGTVFLTIIVGGERVDSREIERIMSMSFGAVHSINDIGQGVYSVHFYDTRAASKCIAMGGPKMEGVVLKSELDVDHDLQQTVERPKRVIRVLEDRGERLIRGIEQLKRRLAMTQ